MAVYWAQDAVLVAKDDGKAGVKTIGLGYRCLKINSLMHWTSHRLLYDWYTMVVLSAAP